MSHFLPLSPAEERLVRDLLVSGRFHSEDDVLHAALRLLHDQSRVGRTTPSGNEAPSSIGSRRSPYGIFADITSDISEEDIAEARREMWGGFPHDQP